MTELENDYFCIQISDKDGLQIESFINKLTNDDILKSRKNTGLFVITADKGQFNASDFIGTSSLVRDKFIWCGFCRSLNLKAHLNIDIDESRESLWNLEIQNTSDTPLKFKLAFPVLDGFIIGDSLECDKYFHGLNGGSMGDFPIDFRAMYGYSLPVMDAYDDNGGVYLRINDTSNLHEVDGNIIEITYGKNCQNFAELIENRKLAVSEKDNKAILAFRIEPKEVLCIVAN